jgi:hypothetical protein
MNTLRLPFLLLLCSVALLLQPVSAQGWVADEQSKLSPADIAFGDTCGYAMAVSGDTIAVGSLGDDDDGSVSGSVNVYVRSGATWSHQAKLTASDAGAFDAFGYSVALSGDTLVVGASGDGDAASGAGSAYVFVRSGTTWSEQAKLMAPFSQPNQRMGECVAVSGDTLAVGAPYRDSPFGWTDAGAVLVYVRSGTVWTLQQELLPMLPQFASLLGISVALEGDRLVTGAPGTDDLGAASGSAFVFERSGSTWTLQPRLLASDGAAGDALGNAVSISGDTVVVGAFMDSDAGVGSGSASVFTHDGVDWSQQAKLTSPSSDASDNFGTSVAVSGDLVLVGAQYEEAVGPSSGSVHLYERHQAIWYDRAAFQAAETVQGDHFGTAVALDGDTAAVGAQSVGTVAPFAGSGYAFLLEDTTWVDLGQALAGSLGEPSNAGWGALAAGEPMSLTLAGALPDDTAFLVVGAAALNLPFKAGVLVPDPNPPGFFIALPTDGTGGLVVNETWPAGIPSGFTVFIQWWQSDAGAIKGFAASNGVSGTTP